MHGRYAATNTVAGNLKLPHIGYPTYSNSTNMANKNKSCVT